METYIDSNYELITSSGESDEEDSDEARIHWLKRLSNKILSFDEIFRSKTLSF